MDTPTWKLGDLPHPMLETRAERVQYLCMLIGGGFYAKGKTLPELAERWNVHWGTMTDYASEARREATRDIESSDEVRQAKIAQLERVTSLAIEAHNKNLNPGHLKNAIEAIKTAAGLGGAPATTRTEQTGANGAPVGVVVQVPVEEDDDE